MMGVPGARVLAPTLLSSSAWPSAAFVGGGPRAPDPIYLWGSVSPREIAHHPCNVAA